jgi:large subunit ribosomal protein L25
MRKLTIEARPRAVVGKKVKSLRKRGVLPANVYGHNIQSQALELNAHDFSLLQRHLSASSILDLVVDGGGPRPVMIHRTQRDVRTGQPSHVEFFQFNPLERLTASVPLVLAGQPESVRRGEAVLLHEMTQIEVTCLPADLPERIEVPIDKLTQVGATVNVGDLVFDRAKIAIKAHADEVVASLTAPQIVEVEEVAAAPEAAEEAPEAAEGTAGEQPS